MNADAANIPTCPTCGGPLSKGASAHGMCPRCAWGALDASDDGLADDILMDLPGLRVVSEIARGGMGVVYRAIEAEAGRDVAVKMMQPALADTPEVRERFAQEARAMGALDHPGILPVYRVGEHHGLPFFAMKLAEGGTLSQHLSRYANDWRGIASLMAGIAEAVHHAHQRGLLHRDLKPGNILFDAAGNAFVSDFGLVKIAGVDSSLTRSVSTLGTPHYMAPEVAERDARASSVASDVWSLGAILYELIAQRLAFQAEGVPALLRKIVDEDTAPLPASTPRDLATITLKCLHKIPAQRYASAGDLAKDLRHWLCGEPVSARRMSGIERMAGWCKRRPALAAVWALLFATLITAASLLIAKNREQKTSLRTALFNQVQAARYSSRVQGRQQALDAVRSAAALGTTPELEEEAASLLALNGLKKVAVVRSEGWGMEVLPDDDLKIVADFYWPDAVHVRDIRSHKELATLPPGAPLTKARHCFSRDGKWICYVEKQSGHLVLCDWRSGQKLMDRQSEAKFGCEFSPDGKTLVIGCEDGGIVAFDLAQPAAEPTIWPVPDPKIAGPKGPLKPAVPTCFSPDGKWLAVRDGQGLDFRIMLHDAQSGKLMRTMGLSPDWSAKGVEWFTDGEGVLIGSGSGHVTAFRFKGSTLRVLPAHEAGVDAVAIQPQGQLAVTCGLDDRVEILDWPTGRVLSTISQSSCFSRFSRDGTSLMLRDGGSAELQLYDVANSSVCHTFTHPDVAWGRWFNNTTFRSLVSPDGRMLATVGFQSTMLYDMATGRCLATLPEEHGHDVAWAASGHQLWSSEKTYLHRYELAPQSDGSVVLKKLAAINLEHPITNGLLFSETADRWVAGVEHGVCYGSISKGNCSFAPLDGPEKAGNASVVESLSRDGRFVIVKEDARYESETHKHIKHVLDLHAMRWADLDTEVTNTSRFTPDGTGLWSQSRDDLRLRETKNWHEVTRIKGQRSTASHDIAHLCADGQLLVTSDGGTLVLRRGDTGEAFLRLRHPIPLGRPSISLSADRRYVAFAAAGHIVRVWDLARLAIEMQKLGLPWRGPTYPNADLPQPVTEVRME